LRMDKKNRTLSQLSFTQNTYCPFLPRIAP
jgi:hypothetical protein